MKAKELAELLLEHPDAEVMALGVVIDDYFPVEEWTLEFSIESGEKFIWINGNDK